MLVIAGGPEVAAEDGPKNLAHLVPQARSTFAAQPLLPSQGGWRAEHGGVWWEGAGQGKSYSSWLGLGKAWRARHRKMSMSIVDSG